MLQHTFIHADGVGPATERKLWAAGIHTWDDFLERHREDKIPFRNLKRLEPIVAESRLALDRRDVGYFAGRLKSVEQWRVYRDFCNQAAFVDIETTGLSPDFDQITIVGLFAGGKFHVFVEGQNLGDFPQVVAEYPLWITFNGAQFDLPFLRKQFPGCGPLAHIDLRYPLAKLGYRGGLKQIERTLDIQRPAHLHEVDGYEAVRLWSAHRRGKSGALEKLIDYCRHDVVNML
ncbi:MAG TPA: ribonuclease H-like domain-containing protein, partial [Polyangiaceae bacterium]